MSTLRHVLASSYTSETEEKMTANDVVNEKCTDTCKSMASSATGTEQEHQKFGCQVYLGTYNHCKRSLKGGFRLKDAFQSDF